MRLALLVSFLGIAANALAATAYNALEALGKARGEKTLDQVTEVRGINGAPQPKEWVIATQDKSARGGVREFGLQGTRIASERTPAGRAPMGRLNLNQLNLDSDGAYTLAERESKKTGFAYDYVDFFLRGGTAGGAPVWELRLVDEKSNRTATMMIAADNGTVLSRDGFSGSVADTGRPIPQPEEEEEDPRDRRPPPQGNFFQRAGNSVEKFANRTGNHMQRRFRQLGDSIHNLFTGDNRDTAGPHPNAKPKKQEPRRTSPPPGNYRDANGTEYYRPRD